MRAYYAQANFERQQHGDGNASASGSRYDGRGASAGRLRWRCAGLPVVLCVQRLKRATTRARKLSFSYASFSGQTILVDPDGPAGPLPAVSVILPAGVQPGQMIQVTIPCELRMRAVAPSNCSHTCTSCSFHLKDIRGIEVVVVACPLPD